MDFRSICQKIDVDSLKAKLPVLPPMPALPQLKLPKLKSRKIFRTSCENVNETDKNLPRSQTATSITQQQPASIPRANFIDYTPNHISTVSSLMHEYSMDGTDPSKKSTYRSACSVDDDYPSSTQPSGSAANLHTTDPISSMPPKVNPQEPSSQITGSTNNVHLSITERIQKGYKDVSEFRLKHIFAKKTVIRKDNIKVDDYVLQYDAERLQEQVERERYDRDVADNYNINFKLATTRQNTVESNDSLDETHSSLSKATTSNESDYDGYNKTSETRAKLPDITTVAPTTEGKVSLDKTSLSASEKNLSLEKKSSKLSSEYKNRLRRLKKYLSSTDENTNEANQAAAGDETDTKSTKMNREESLHKRNDQVVSQESTEHLDSNEKPLSTIKQNIKRFHKSIKQSQLLQGTAGEPSRSENKHIESQQSIKSTRRENLRSSKSVEEISGQSESSGFRKLQTWKTSLEKQASRAVSGSIIGFKGSPPQAHNSQEVFPNGLFKKIKCICSRKSCNPNEEVDNSECKQKECETMGSKIEIREVNKKLSFSEEHIEQIEQTEEDDVDDVFEKDEVVCVLLDDDDEPETDTREHYLAHDTNKDDIREYTSIKSEYIEKRNGNSNQLATWTTQSILCERSIEPEEAISTFPHVYLHQDSSDAFRPTLIVAVTRPETDTPHSPKLREIIPEDEMPITSALRDPSTYSTPSTPYDHITPNYLNKKYPYKYKSHKQLGAHNRSADSNPDLKMWTINQENSDCEPRLIYKTKNIDIFDNSEDKGYGPAVFEDFDEELCNEPIVLIASDRSYCDQDSSDDGDSFNDNISHVTKICVPAIIETKSNEIIEESECQQISNENLTDTRSSHTVETDRKLETHKDVNDNDSDNDEVYNNQPLPPESSPPTSCSPIPPPLPERRQPSLPKNQEYYLIASPVDTPLEDNDCLPPALPNSKPPEPSPINTPQFKCSEGPILTTQKSKPLVKTSSLRLAFNEQVRPSDIGKVNKLISRFEQPGSKSFDRSIITVSRHRSQHSIEYSDNESEEVENQVAACEVHDVNQIPVPSSNVLVKDPINLNEEKQSGTNNNEPKLLERGNLLKIPEINHFSDIHKTTHHLDRKNANCSHLEPESTLAIPSQQLLTVNKTTAESERKHLQYQLEYQQRNARRSRRSMTRDDENFYSFDSDEENSYYSISPSGSSRFVVDI